MKFLSFFQAIVCSFFINFFRDGNFSLNFHLVFKATSSNSDMLYVAIVDPDMKTVVHSVTELIGENKPVAQDRLYRKSADGTIVRELTNLSGSIFEICCPIVFMKKSLGSVIIGMNRSIPLQAQRKVRNIILISHPPVTITSGITARAIQKGWLATIFHYLQR